MKGKIHH